MLTHLFTKFSSVIKIKLTWELSLYFLLLIISNIALANMPDYYSEPGINNFRDYNAQNNYEMVDPFTGKLQLSHTDILIPGNGGLDLKVTRSYTSGNRSGSWVMHFGYVYRNSATTPICAKGLQVSNKTNPVLVLPDGSTQILSDSDSAEYLFISNQHWKSTCATNGNGLIVTSPEGTVYEMTYSASNSSQSIYYVQKITDKNANTILVNYTNPNGNGAKLLV
jgi:hypothetical protein